MYRAAAFNVMSVLAIILLVHTARADEPQETGQPAPQDESPDESDQGEPSAPSAVRIIEGDVKIDASALKSSAWKTAIRKATEYPHLRAGGQVTLLRVLFDDERASQTTGNAVNEPIVVNGVRLFLPGLINRIELAAFFESPEPPRTEEANNIQLASVKLVRFDDFPNGGGMYQELSSGDFVLVEHINSTRREDGRDPVMIGSFTHHHAKIGIPVPPRGQLGVAGDVVLTRPENKLLGRVIAEILFEGDASNDVRQFRIGPVVVGGRYGRSFDFNEHGVCSTDQLVPGQYRTLLPDFDMVKSRWEVAVKPGEVTYLRFIASSGKEVRLESERHMSFAAGN